MPLGQCCSSIWARGVVMARLRMPRSLLPEVAGLLRLITGCRVFRAPSGACSIAHQLRPITRCYMVECVLIQRPADRPPAGAGSQPAGAGYRLRLPGFKDLCERPHNL